MAKILIVDDDQIILDVMDLWLKSKGHSISQAHDGDEALDLLHAEDFDLMITDLIMPRTEGIQLILEVRRTHKVMGIIAISSGGKKGSEKAGNYLNAAEKLGADAILAKPLEQGILIRTVNALLNP